MKYLTLGVALTLAAAPISAMAASYFSLSIDKKTLIITDLKAPRLTGDKAETYAFVIYRTPIKAGKKTTDHLINKVEIDCTAGKARQFYSAAYDYTGGFVSSEVNPKPWAKIAPNSKEDALRNLGCHALQPVGGFPIGDKLLHVVIDAYRSGQYDRYIH